MSDDLNRQVQSDRCFFVDGHAVGLNFLGGVTNVTASKCEGVDNGPNVRTIVSIENIRVTDAVALDLGYAILSHLLGWPIEDSRTDSIGRETQNVG